MVGRTSPEHRRYSRAVIMLMGGYVATLVGVNLFFENSAPTGVSAYAAALLPALPVIGVFVVLGRLLRSLRDEYQRYLMTRQMLIATGFTLTVATAWGFVESFGLLPHVPAFYATVLWFAGLGLGSCVNALLERREGGE